MLSTDLIVKMTSHKKEALITEEMCSNWYCYAKEEKSFDSHPLSYGQLETAQKADKEVMKILKKDDSVYKLHDFHGGEQLSNWLVIKTK